MGQVQDQVGVTEGNVMKIEEVKKSENRLVDVAQQDAIFDGRPNFASLYDVINKLNQHAAGGTPKDLERIKKQGKMENPKRYRVQLHLYVEELE